MVLPSLTLTNAHEVIVVTTTQLSSHLTMLRFHSFVGREGLLANPLSGEKVSAKRLVLIQDLREAAESC